MDTENLKAHLFICTRCQTDELDRDDVAAWRKELKNHCVDKYTKKVVKVSASGCLGYCDNGVNAVFIPRR